MRTSHLRIRSSASGEISTSSGMRSVSRQFMIFLYVSCDVSEQNAGYPENPPAGGRPPPPRQQIPCPRSRPNTARGPRTDEHLVHDDAQRPPVALVPIALLHEDLGRNVVRRAHGRVRLIWARCWARRASAARGQAERRVGTGGEAGGAATALRAHIDVRAVGGSCATLPSLRGT